MNEAILQMLQKYNCQTVQDYSHATKEILQEIALLGLWRAKFFEKAAFYGGTALRILYGLDRFSEDLDFSLLEVNPNFDLSLYLKAIQTEIQSFGFQVSVEKKEKTNDTAILSAFLKANTQETMLTIQMPNHRRAPLHKEEILKIKLEVDTEPPLGFSTQMKYLLQPIPFAVKTFSDADLFAGKMHAVLCRSWKNRVKGRDWYDFIWFVSRKIPLHLQHLEKRMVQSGHLHVEGSLDRELFQNLLMEKIENLDIESALKDISPFIKNGDQIAIWSKDFFRAVASQIILTSN
ncbi:MAG: hypothetical protein K0S74_879 [Chlamydiales bacterium]|jgi:predicted nucleotidyltransferase component of viral defense system|nr:hypothetical protein [Chlamydiales bacterium]